MPKTKEPIFDVRTIERDIHKGKIKRKDYETYLKNLPDDSDKMAELNLEEED